MDSPSSLDASSLDAALPRAQPMAFVEPAELQPRRRPSQARSRIKFDSMLAAARSLLVDAGFESMTCEEVAARAGVPIGTLYQYFANKYVIVCELNRQDMMAVSQELLNFDGEIPSLDWLRHMNKMVDHLAQLWTSDPSRSQVWIAMQSTPATRAAAAAHEKEFAALVANMLRPLMPHTPARKRTMMADVLVHVVYSMLNFAVQDDQTASDAVAELKRLMMAYLRVAEKESRSQR